MFIPNSRKPNNTIYLLCVFFLRYAKDDIAFICAILLSYSFILDGGMISYIQKYKINYSRWLVNL